MWIARRAFGRLAPETAEATRRYAATLRRARRAFITGLEGARLNQPRDFWRLLRPYRPPPLVAPRALHAHYNALLATAPAGSPPEEWLPPSLAAQRPLEAGEVLEAVHTLRRNKALGTSWLSPELLVYHRDSSIYDALATLFNSLWQHGPPP